MDEEKGFDLSKTVHQVIATNDLPFKEHQSNKISEEIKAQRVSLLQFIQALGTGLTAESDSVRVKTVEFLSMTLPLLRDSLSRQDINVLNDYLLSKFDDHVSLQHTLAGLNSLIHQRNFIFSMNRNVEKILNKILNEYQPRLHLAKVRYETFRILKSLLEGDPGYFQSDPNVSRLYLKSFIHIASGEKDPRNLLISFENNIKINQLFDFDPSHDENDKFYVHELFDICFCYFPISFTPPPNDPYKISDTTLKLKLRETIGSQSLFYTYAFPELLEKLTSTNPTVRNDVLKTLLYCLTRYDIKVFDEWQVLWDALKFEILHNEVTIFKPQEETLLPLNYDENVSDSDEYKPLLLTIEIIRTISQKLSATDKLAEFLQFVLNEQELADGITEKSSKQVVLLLCGVGSGSKEAFNAVVKFLFSYNIWGKFLSTDDEIGNEPEEKDEEADFALDITKQRDIIDNLGFLFSTYKDVISFVMKEDPFLAFNELVSRRDQLLIFLGQILHASSNLEEILKCKVIQQLVKLCRMPFFFTTQECSLSITYFKDILISKVEFNDLKWDSDNVLQEVIAGLRKLLTDPNDRYNEKTNLVLELVFPNLFLMLTTNSKEKGSDSEYEATLKKGLSLFRQLCVTPYLLEVVSIRLLNLLQGLEDFDNTVVYEHVLDMLLESTKSNEASEQFLLNSWYRNFVPRFLRSIDNVTTKFNNWVIIELAGDLLGLIVLFTEKSKHQAIVDDLLNAFIFNKPTAIGFQADLLHNPSLLINILNKGLANCDVSCQVNFDDAWKCDTLLSSLITVYNHAEDGFLLLNYLQTLALLVNKFTKEDAFIYQKIENSLKNLSTKHQMTLEDKKDLEISLWMLKGLVTKADKTGFLYARELFMLLNSPNETVRMSIAKSIGILFTDVSIFTKPLNSKRKKPISGVQPLNVRMLYKQNLFEALLPLLVDGFRLEEQRDKSIYLTTLALILTNVPAPVLQAHVEDIFPMLVSTLKMNNTRMLVSVISTIEVILTSLPEKTINYVSTLVPRFCELATRKVIARNIQVNTEEIRLKSLGCLLLIFTKLELHYTLPYKNSTLKDLANALDDNKRTVRKSCSDVRQSLFVLDR